MAEPAGPPFVILSTCKGGGYRYARTDPPHPRRNAKGLYPLHRVLMENKLGRLLRPGEEVHHHDEDKSNDDPDNLRLKTKADHARDHAIERAPDAVEVTCPCGNKFKLKAHVYRQRMERSQSGVLTCSRSCGTRSGSKSRRSSD